MSQGEPPAASLPPNVEAAQGHAGAGGTPPSSQPEQPEGFQPSQVTEQFPAQEAPQTGDQQPTAYIPAPQNQPAAYSPAPAGAQYAAPAPMPRKKRRGLTVLTAVLVVVIGLGVAAYAYIQYQSRTTYAPEARVEAYLQALVDGRASDALELSDMNAATAQRVLLTDEVYRAADMRPTDFRIDDVQAATDAEEQAYADDSPAGEEASKHVTVEASITIDSKRYPMVFELRRAGSVDMFFDDWQIMSSPASGLYLIPMSENVTVNGVEVSVPEVPDDIDDPLLLLPALPGNYTVSAPEATKYRTFGEDQSALVVPNSITEREDGEYYGAETTETIAFTQGWTDQLAEDAIAQVKARIDQCMASNTFEPEGCEDTLDMSEPSYAVTDIKRTWTTEPEITFDDGTGEDTITTPDEPLVVIRGGDLKIDYKWRYEADEAWEPDDSKYSSVFSSWLSNGTRVPVIVGQDDSLELDFSNF
ncbi:MAG: hypothetical protein Q4P36_08500 [Bowdeniella nasicola]|nr:hypothetical protein [Bowdeniella nasicola]